MDEILEQASKLGKLIAQDPRARNMAAAQKALEQSSEDRQLLTDYEDGQHQIALLEQQGKPIEPEDKVKLADLHQSVIASQVIKDLLKAQTDYIELMTAVSGRVETQATERSDS